jgi:exodeoxyribonuclease VII large subunit
MFDLRFVLRSLLKSPGYTALAVLGRGYSLTRLASGSVVRRAAEIEPGAVIEILLHEGSLDARVERVRERDERHHV